MTAYNSHGPFNSMTEQGAKYNANVKISGALEEQKVKNRQSQQYDLNKLLGMAKRFENKTLNPLSIGSQACIDFSNECRRAIQDLQAKQEEMRLYAGLQLQMNKMDHYNHMISQVDTASKYIRTLEKFI